MAVTDLPARLVYRRFQPAWWVLVGVWFVVSAAMYRVGPAGSHLWVLLVMGAYGITLYLAGPAASVVVSRQEVLVRNVFVRWRVARSQVGAVEEFDWSDATMAIHGRADVIDLTAFGSIGRGEGRKRPTRWTWLPAALDRVPRMSDDGRWSGRPHWFNIILAALAVAAFVTACLSF